MSTTIHLLRHGKVYNPDRVLYGRMPGFHLSTEGQEQAQAAGRHLAREPLAAIFSSPQPRAQETAGYLQAASTVSPPLQVDERLDETYTPFDGTPIDEMIARDWDIYTGSEPPYEQPEDILRRAWDFVQAMRQDYARGQVAAVTHGDIVVFTFMHAHGLGTLLKDRLQLQRLGITDGYPATASVVSLTFHTESTDEVPQTQYIRPY